MVLIPDLNLKLIRGSTTILSEQQASKSNDLWRLADKKMLSIRWVSKEDTHQVKQETPVLVKPASPEPPTQSTSLEAERFERLKEHITEEVRRSVSEVVGQAMSTTTKDHLRDALHEVLAQMSLTPVQGIEPTPAVRIALPVEADAVFIPSKIGSDALAPVETVSTVQETTLEDTTAALRAMKKRGNR